MWRSVERGGKLKEIWERFIEIYRDKLFNWSLRYTLEIFWHFCQGGEEAVDSFFKKRFGVTGQLRGGEKE